MKKSKLLLATPLMLAPMVSLIPAVASCSKKTADITISSELSENVDVTAISQQLVVGEPYVLSLTIKEDKIGKEFLPNYLTTVKSNGEELTQYTDEPENALSDYYQYWTTDENSVGYLFIWSAKGPISIEAKTSQLASVIATPINLEDPDTVEYEVGESASTAIRVVPTAKLKNGDTFTTLTGYTVNLTDYTSTYVFTDDDIAKTTSGKTGTITYCGVTSDAFTFKVIAKTAAWLKTGILDPTYKKYSSIADAISAYNSAGEGTYTIGLVTGYYEFDQALTINEATGKYLTIEALEDPEIDDWVMECAVNFKLNSTTDVDHLINIVNTDTTWSSNCSITISGIGFMEPTTEATAYCDIWLDSGAEATVAPHNITISQCKFIGGDETDDVPVNAVYGQYEASSDAPHDIIMNLCVGECVNTLYTGYVEHDGATDYDLSIIASYLWDSQQLADITSDGDVDVLIDGVTANIMYTDDGEATDLTSGLVINGAGTYDIRNSSFVQLATTSGDIGGFIETKIESSVTQTGRYINFYNVSFDKHDEETKMHTVLNSSNTQDEDWTITATYDVLPDENGTAYGIPATGQTKYWDSAYYAK